MFSLIVDVLSSPSFNELLHVSSLSDSVIVVTVFVLFFGKRDGCVLGITPPLGISPSNVDVRVLSLWIAKNKSLFLIVLAFYFLT